MSSGGVEIVYVYPVYISVGWLLSWSILASCLYGTVSAANTVSLDTPTLLSLLHQVSVGAVLAKPKIVGDGRHMMWIINIHWFILVSVQD